jgi:hypothetical protein
MWIDAVGGFLVCLADDVMLGQAVPGHRPDIPIFGDLSRRHAWIRRRGEGYVIEPIGRVRLGGHEATSRKSLADGDEIELGARVLLRFRQPHPLSGTARLEFLSHHGTQPSADAVLLMADSCVLGPKTHNHVVCRNWSHDVVLYRSGLGQLFCRADEGVVIDGKPFASGHGPLCDDSRVTGRDFALSLESI